MLETITERIDRITGLTQEYLTVTPPAPYSTKIEITGICNFKCYFCARAYRLREQKEMDQKFFERIVVEMREAGVEELGLFYLGESFCCKWLEEACYFAKNVAGYPYTFLTTNGSLATPDRVEKLMANGLDSLKFSLNYADDDQFEEIAQVNKNNFQKMKDNIKAAYEVKEKGGYSTMLSGSYIQYDGEQGEKMQHMIDELSPYLNIYALPLYNQANLVGDATSDKGWHVTAGNRGRLDNLRDPLPCWSAFTEGHISWDQRLSACCFDHDGRFTMGDLSKDSFMDCWHSQKFQDLRAAHLKKNVDGTICQKCVAYN